MSPLKFSLFLALTAQLHVAAQETNYLFNTEIDSLLKADVTPYKFQTAAWRYAFKGDIARARKVKDDQFPQARPSTPSDAQKDQLSNYRKVDAYKTISEEAGRHQFFILNESHLESQDRVFMMTLLKDLKKQGYRWLGLEALREPADSLNDRGYPIPSSGYYIQDPAYANMIRVAFDEGFRIFGYEQNYNDSIQKKLDREAAQATNVAEYYSKHRDGKVVIYCGYDHAVEDTLRNFMGLPMAGRVKILCGTDPFTLDQTGLSEKHIMSSAYRKLIDTEDNVVLIDSSGKYFTAALPGKKIDCEVYHPNTTYNHGRASVLENKYFRFANIAKDVKLGFPLIAEVYLADQQDGVPVDVFEFQDALEGMHVVIKRKKRHVIKLRDRQGNKQTIKYND